MMLWCLWRLTKRFGVGGRYERCAAGCAFTARGSETVAGCSGEIHWQPPEEDCVKCNIDAAIFGEQRCFGFGMCFRNSQGHFVKALTKEMLSYGLVK